METLPLIKLGSPNEFMLKQPCAKIDKNDIGKYKDQIHKMAEFITNPDNKAVGLSFPQIGILRRAFVMRFPDNRVLAALNPMIVDTGREFYPLEEQCLSEPNIKKVVVRANKITMKFMSLDGVDTRITLLGFEARIAQHEIDHLDGILLVDK